MSWPFDRPSTVTMWRWLASWVSLLLRPPRSAGRPVLALDYSCARLCVRHAKAMMIGFIELPFYDSMLLFSYCIQTSAGSLLNKLESTRRASPPPGAQGSPCEQLPVHSPAISPDKFPLTSFVSACHATARPPMLIAPPRQRDRNVNERTN